MDKGIIPVLQRHCSLGGEVIAVPAWICQFCQLPV
jgi:hypothetical protein